MCRNTSVLTNQSGHDLYHNGPTQRTLESPPPPLLFPPCSPCLSICVSLCIHFSLSLTVFLPLPLAPCFPLPPPVCMICTVFKHSYSEWICLVTHKHAQTHACNSFARTLACARVRERARQEERERERESRPVWVFCPATITCVCEER
jgi:hypothetical protein